MILPTIILLALLVAPAEDEMAFPSVPLTKSERQLIANVLHFEARGEGRRGQEAVANVIRNRLESGIDYLGSGSVKQVLQPERWVGTNVKYPKASLKRYKPVIDRVFGGRAADNTGGALYYRNPNTSSATPWHVNATRQIGSHVFYRGQEGGVLNRVTDDIPPLPEQNPSFEMAVKRHLANRPPPLPEQRPLGPVAENAPPLPEQRPPGRVADVTPPLPGQRPSGAPEEVQSTQFLQGRLTDGNEDVAGLEPSFQNRLAALIDSAPPNIKDKIKINSAYRSPEHQARLWEAALDRYGSPAKARKWVAPPGRSQHNHRRAADLTYGQRGSPDPKVRRWVHKNAPKFGLHFPLGNEPWHIEPVEARGGSVPKVDLPTKFGGSIEATPPIPAQRAVAQRVQDEAEPDIEARAPPMRNFAQRNLAPRELLQLTTLGPGERVPERLPRLSRMGGSATRSADLPRLSVMEPGTPVPRELPGLSVMEGGSRGAPPLPSQRGPLPQPRQIPGSQEAPPIPPTQAQRGPMPPTPPLPSRRSTTDFDQVFGQPFGQLFGNRFSGGGMIPPPPPSPPLMRNVFGRGGVFGPGGVFTPRI